MRKIKTVLILLVAVVVAFSCRVIVSFADDIEEQGQPVSIDELLENLDITEINNIFSSFDDGQQEMIGGTVEGFIDSIATGEKAVEFADIWQYFYNVLTKSLIKILPTCAILIAICLILSLFSGMSGDMMSSSLGTVINFTGMISVSGILLFNASVCISEVGKYINQISSLSSAVFPVLFTLMSAIGASSSTSLYQPAIAIFTGSIMQIISGVIAPMVIISVVIAIIGNLSGSIRLNNLHKLIIDISKWLLRTGFFVFLAFLSLQGIITGVSDSISYRIGKFALSKYVPIIGGYISDGFNYVIAGSIIIKNSIGITAIIMLFVQFLPVYLSVVLTSFSLKIVSSVAEPLGLSQICSALNKASESLSLMGSVCVGITFIFVIFQALIMLSGNVVV